MGVLRLGSWFLPSALEACLLFRARREKSLCRFPLFYSYVAFLFFGSIVLFPIYFFRPQDYASAYWFRLTIAIVAEFAVLAEVSNRLFMPYPVIRRLGLSLTIFIGATFTCFYVVPAFFRPQPSSMVFFEFAKRASLTKAVIIAAFVGAAGYYRLSLSKNVGGILLGFMLHLGPSMAVFAGAGAFGKTLYSGISEYLFPLSYVVRLVTWTVALWRYEPALPAPASIDGTDEVGYPRLSNHLGRFNSVLTRLLGK